MTGLVHHPGTGGWQRGCFGGPSVALAYVDLTMSLDESLISHVVRHPAAFAKMQQLGVSEDDFVDENRMVWRYLHRVKRSRGTIPSKAVVEARFPDFEWFRPKERDIPILIDQLKQRRKWKSLLDIIDTAATEAGTPENVDDALQSLQGAVNRLAASNGTNSHLVDLFDGATAQKMLREIKQRKFGGGLGMPTGLKRIDQQLGGMMKGRMIVVVGRPGLGKSWLNLLFVANAVINGHKWILYPLEMTLPETAFRLYTIFSSNLFGANKAIKNTDLTQGTVTKAKIVKFLHLLEDKFSGQLYVADVGSLSDPYTNERIESEVELHKPDGFWVDYLTLMKAPEQKKGGDDYSAVRYLSSGIKGTAIRQDCVGGCSAQINREALRVRSFIPRLEHIAYGDSIGQDADQVISINRRGEYLYYGVVKNRHGPEIQTTRVKFFVDTGVIEETVEQGTEDDD